jgi:alpha-N-arabinofuranosidase
MACSLFFRTIIMIFPSRAFVLSLLILGLRPVQAGDQPWVVFDWFQYQGNDVVFDEVLKTDHFRNPVIAGFHPDPSIVRVERDYYLVTSSFAYFPGLPIFHSTDLVNWKQIGHALTRRSQLTLENGQGISRGIFAPTLRFHDGFFYIITTDVDGAGNFYITAGDPAGPWSDPVRLPEIKGIDPDLFFDDDGRVYITHNGEPDGPALYDGHRAIWMWEYDMEARKVIPGSGKVIVNGGVDLAKEPIWIEAPHIYRINGWYYLSCAEGGTADQHSQVIFRTRSLDEPFVAYANNPVLTQRDLDPERPDPITSTGHADLVQTAEGQWWAVFLGIRPYDRSFHNTGRETFLLPVRWQDEWPVILDPQTAVPWQVRRPAIEPNESGIPPQSGNFTWRDDFDTPRLKPDWMKVRTSETQWVRLDAAAGTVSLAALRIPLKEKAQPAFLARVQQHLNFSASTQMELPLAKGVAAGLVAFQSSDFHYFLGVRKTATGYTIFLEELNQGIPRIIANADFMTPAEQIVLGLEQEDAKLNFYFSLTPQENVELVRNVDAKLLSTQVAGGFVGATVGIHARSE